jgi:hypothetical protein
MRSFDSNATGGTFLHLEFGTDVQGATPLGDIAATLVSIDELLRDLSAIAAYPSHAEFRNIEVVAIETRERLKVTLSLLAIPEQALDAFQDICRDIIVFRGRPDHGAELPVIAWQDVIARRLTAVTTALHNGGSTETSRENRLTVDDARRLQRHMDVLLNAAMPLRRVEVQKE